MWNIRCAIKGPERESSGVKVLACMPIAEVRFLALLKVPPKFKTKKRKYNKKRNRH